jgi:dCMP deaminase
MSNQWEEFLIEADKAASKSNCVRRAVGAIIVARGKLLAVGYNGVPSSFENCLAAGCIRCASGGDLGVGYECCICVHAEQRAIADLSKRTTSRKNTTLVVNLRPCLTCLLLAREFGIENVVYKNPWTFASSPMEKLYREVSGHFKSFVCVNTETDTKNVKSAKPKST